MWEKNIFQVNVHSMHLVRAAGWLLSYVGSASDVTDWAVRASSAHLQGRSGGTGSQSPARPQQQETFYFDTI